MKNNSTGFAVPQSNTKQLSQAAVYRGDPKVLPPVSICMHHSKIDSHPSKEISPSTLSKAGSGFPAGFLPLFVFTGFPGRFDPLLEVCSQLYSVQARCEINLKKKKETERELEQKSPLPSPHT